MKRAFLLIILILSVPYPLWGQDSTLFDTYIEAMMSLYDIPGASVVMVHNGQVIHAKGYGVRNTDTMLPVTTHTQFAIGSITKSFTALAVAQLVDAGILDLDRPIIDYLPDFHLTDEAATQTLTLRHLLSHSSGLPRADEFWYEERRTRQAVIQNMATIELTAAPGEIWQYNNQNFALAGWIIEQVTGLTWEKYVQENILAPLGMTSANFDVTIMQQQADYAVPHSLDVLMGMEPIPFFEGLGSIGPAGSINANILEMANYLLFQLGDGTFGENQMVSSKMFQEMHTEQIASYGLGWVLGQYKGQQTIWHDGSIDGFSASMVMIPSENVGVIVLTNADISTAYLFTAALPLGLLDRLLDWGIEPRIEVTLNEAYGFDPELFQSRLAAARSYQVNAQLLSRLIGRYDWEYGKMMIVLQAGRLHWIIAHQNGDFQNLELVPISKSEFLINEWGLIGIIITFEVNPNGMVMLFQDRIPVARRAVD